MANQNILFCDFGINKAFCAILRYVEPTVEPFKNFESFCGSTVGAYWVTEYTLCGWSDGPFYLFIQGTSKKQQLHGGWDVERRVGAGFAWRWAVQMRLAHLVSLLLIMISDYYWLLWNVIFNIMTYDCLFQIKVRQMKCTSTSASPRISTVSCQTKAVQALRLNLAQSGHAWPVGCAVEVLLAQGSKTCPTSGSWRSTMDNNGTLSILPLAPTPKYRSRGEIPKILELAWGKAFVEVVALWRLACV